MKKGVIWVLALLFVLSLGPALAGEKELKAVCFLSKKDPMAAMTVEWVKRINEYCRGELRIQYGEGPQGVSAFDEVEALRKGAFQVAFSSTGRYESIFPEGAAFSLSRLAPWEERRPGGFYDFMVERHREIKVMYLGRWLHGSIYLWLKKPVTGRRELKGRRLGTGPGYDRFLKALGAVPVKVSPTGSSGAQEGGSLEGLVSPVLGVRRSGWIETCRYAIDHPLYNQSCTILMNLDTWNGFPLALQERIQNLTAWFEPYMVGYFDSAEKMEWGELEKAGIDRIHFSPSDARAYVDTAYRVEWKALEDRLPDLAPRLKELTEY
ncbi:MAG: hypothetical protein JRJ26_13680 [Deltaproteobacteria bacterium]|nr:hypothetical protein [Deltaproteobacteria bacterium]